MKTLAFSVIAISGIIFAGIFFHNAYAPCLMGVSSCGPPPGVTVEIWTDNASYEKNDTITVNGILYSSNNGTTIPIQLYSPQNILIKTYNAAVNASNKFSLKINGNFNDSGQYVLAACNQGWCDREYIKIIASPYILQDGDHAFPINYRTIADVDTMGVNTGEDSLLIHLSDAPIGSIFQISMPRNLIDSTFANGTDYDFTVLAGENSVQKLMSKANFNETQTSQTSRTLEIKIPSYSQIADMQGEMYVKIIGTKMYEVSDLETLSPLNQLKSGVLAKNITCNQELQLVIKAEDGSPACVRPENVATLVERGWARQAFYYHDAHVKPKITLNDYNYVGIDKEGNATVSINNQTYYQTTLDFSADNLPKATPIQFQNVTFTFPEGTMITPGGAFVMLDVKFSDGFEEIYGTHAANEFGGILVPTPYGPHLAVNSTTVLSNHMRPQAGITISHDRVKLLVSADNPTFSESSISSENSCGQFHTAPENQHNSNAVPVLLMNSNSTACANLTFTIASNYKDCNGQTCQEVLRLNSTLSIGNFHYEKHGNLFSVSTGKDYTHSFQITVVPQTVDLANFPIGSNYTVTYIIKSLPNATGFYDYSIPRLSCGVYPYPLAVGHTADQVNYSDFSYIDQQIHSCFLSPYGLTAVEISGMSYKEVALP
ncbi:MAG: hypothetical protein ACREBI_05965 [Nitrosotalea sp.]